MPQPANAPDITIHPSSTPEQNAEWAGWLAHREGKSPGEIAVAGFRAGIAAINAAKDRHEQAWREWSRRRHARPSRNTGAI